MSGQLQGKIALITGGGSGIGAAVAKRFVQEGAKIVITGRRIQALDTIVSGHPEGCVLPFAGDVRKPGDAVAMVEATVKFGGRIDILVNNAGIDNPGAVADVPTEDWVAVLETNLYGPFYTMRAALPYMIKAGGGSIINISSLAGLRRIPSMAAYCSSKSGLIGLTESVALDYGKYNIRCNAVCPGATRTEMTEGSMRGLADSLGTDITGAMDYLTRFNPLPHPATSEQITGAVVFLAGDDSAMVTGISLPVDSGSCIVDPCGSALSGREWGA